MSNDIVAAIIAFSVMILCHEFGHFLIAKRVGITVREFALGFGRRIAGFQRGETMYAINFLLFGGYVRLAGEDLDTSDDPNSFRAKTVWQRIAVVAAGPIMNLFLAVVLSSGMALALGVPVGVTNRIGQLMSGWPAEQAGLRPGDAIVAIDGVPMRSGDEVIETIHRNPNKTLRLTVERDGKQFAVQVTSRYDAQQKIGLIGFRPESLRSRLPLLGALSWGVTNTGLTARLILSAVGTLVVRPRDVFKQLSGPVGAVVFLGETARAGWEIFLYTAAALSVMIGIFNLLPIPALDGGRLLFLVVEAFRRRPVDPRREGYIHLVGLALLILLMVTLSVRDVGKLLGL